MILVDTSIWIALFREKNPLSIEELVPFDQVVTCLPVIQEVLQGFRLERAHRTGRRRGLTIRSSVDCLIAVCALRHDMPVLHSDRDCELLAEVSPLKAIAVAFRHG